LGDITVAAGSNVTLTQADNTITIASPGGASGNRVTATASSEVTIAESADTDLLSVTITKSQASSALLILATVQLNHASSPNSKRVDLKVFRGSAQLDASYSARIGTANEAVRDLPVSLHFWDTSAAGTYTFTLRARASESGAKAAIRRLTVIELL
jgi:hypothetical protein